MEAQNYRAVVPAEEAWFIGPYNEIRAIKPDSVVSSGSDSLIWHYPALNPDMNTMQLDTMAPSWAGRYTIVRTGGDEIFFNSNLDSIFFKTYLPVGSSWTFFRFPNGDYYQATIFSQSFINTPVFSDSAKTIHFQLYDSSNQPVFGNFNGNQVVISKNHGFTELFDLNNFPNDNNTWQRTDAHRLTKGEIYNFSIGDQLQYIVSYAQATAPPPKIVRTVIAKTSWLPDSVQYVFYREDTWYTVVAQNIDTFYTAANETLTVVYPDSLLFAEYPDQPIHEFPNISSMKMNYYDVSSCSSLSVERDFIFRFDTTCHCYPLPFEQQTDLHLWIAGLGQLNGRDDIPNNVSWQEILVYYRVGTDSCGNSIVTHAETVSGNSISVSPNPATNSITINGENLYSKIRILDITGKTVQEIQPAGKTTRVDVSELPAGIYFILCENASGISTGKFVKE